MMQKEQFLKRTVVVCFLALICCILWGSAFPGIKIGYQLWHISAKDMASQIVFAGVRFFLAGVLTIIIGSILQRKILFPGKENGKAILCLAAFQTVIQYLFFYIGLAHTTGVKASILTACNVFFAILIAGVLLHQEKLNKRILIGCLLGFLGVICINMQSGSVELHFIWNGDGFILLAALSYAISSVMIKQYGKTQNTVLLSGYQFMVGGIVLWIAGSALGGKIQNGQSGAVAIILYLAFVSAVAYSLWGILLKYNPVSKVTVFGFFNPIAGVILSALLLQEKQDMGFGTLFALILVSCGIYLVNRSPDRKKMDRDSRKIEKM